MDEEAKKIEAELQKRFSQLHPVVQNAITSAQVTERLQELSETHKLHFDQWDKLENEVMMALLGIEKIEDLETNLRTEVGLSSEAASTISADVFTKIFGPIREEMARQTRPADTQPVPLQNDQMPIQQTPPPEITAEPKAPVSFSETYKGGVASKERKSIDGDPYREPIS
jgi:hypothetical protein